MSTTKRKASKPAVKGKRGGARPGAGRPILNPEGRTEVVGVSIPIALIKRLQRVDKKRSFGGLVTDAVRQYLNGRDASVSKQQQQPKSKSGARACVTAGTAGSSTTTGGTASNASVG